VLERVGGSYGLPHVIKCDNFREQVTALAGYDMSQVIMKSALPSLIIFE